MEELSPGRCVLRLSPDAAGEPRPQLWIYNGYPLLRQVLADYLDVSSDGIQLDRDVHGRTTLAAAMIRDNPRAAALDFSLSHAEDVGVVAVVPEGRVGVDVEVMNDGLEVSGVAEAHLLPAERQFLESRLSAARMPTFLRFWTAKEAFLKAVGLGMSFGLDQVEVELSPDGSARFTRINGSAQLAVGWMLQHHTVRLTESEAVIAVAWGA